MPDGRLARMRKTASRLSVTVVRVQLDGRNILVREDRGSFVPDGREGGALAQRRGRDGPRSFGGRDGGYGGRDGGTTVS